jgi:hypothetical protein
MTGKYIPVEDAAKEWMKDPEFVAAYDALQDEFALASATVMGADGDDTGRKRQVVKAGELTAAEIELIARAEVPTEHAHLDEEIKDWKP